MSPRRSPLGNDDPSRKDLQWSPRPDQHFDDSGRAAPRLPGLSPLSDQKRMVYRFLRAAVLESAQGKRCGWPPIACCGPDSSVRLQTKDELIAGFHPARSRCRPILDEQKKMNPEPGFPSLFLGLGKIGPGTRKENPPRKRRRGR